MRLLFVALVFAAAGDAFGQADIERPVPRGTTAGGDFTSQGPAATTRGNSAGILPVEPPVQEPIPPMPGGDVVGQPGFFRPAPPEAVVVPPLVPTTPGVVPIDTATPATVGASSSDRRLRDSVADALATVPELQGARINVLVEDGAVSLSGTALDERQADVARQIAERLAGPANVTANISRAQ